MTDRMETGPVQFGDDWPGVFIRGDQALHFAHILSVALEDITDVFLRSAMRGLSDTLASCKAPCPQAIVIPYPLEPRHD